MAAAADASDPRLVRMLDGVSTGARSRRHVVPGTHLGPRADAKPTAAVESGFQLGDGPLILRLTLKTAELIGETPSGRGLNTLQTQSLQTTPEDGYSPSTANISPYHYSALSA